jgi:hypothetical protein
MCLDARSIVRRVCRKEDSFFHDDCMLGLRETSLEGGPNIQELKRRIQEHMRVLLGAF